MSAKPIGKMIGGMFGFRENEHDPQTTAQGGAAPENEQNRQQGVTGEEHDVGTGVPAAAGHAAATPDPAESTTAPGQAGEPAAAPAPDQPEAKEQSQIDLDVMEERLIDAMRTVYDPEIPVDIYELGLIYSLRVRPGGIVDIEMTLTTPNCPVAGSMPAMVENVARMVEGVTDVHVELVWDPIWNPEMMSEAARLQLNMY